LGAVFTKDPRVSNIMWVTITHGMTWEDVGVKVCRNTPSGHTMALIKFNDTVVYTFGDPKHRQITLEMAREIKLSKTFGSIILVPCRPQPSVPEMTVCLEPTSLCVEGRGVVLKGEPVTLRRRVPSPQ